jgi:hypothetical protein
MPPAILESKLASQSLSQLSIKGFANRSTGGICMQILEQGGIGNLGKLEIMTKK